MSLERVKTMRPYRRLFVAGDEERPDCGGHHRRYTYGIWLYTGAPQGGRAAVHRYGHCRRAGCCHASAIAAGGGKPVFGVYSTFIQRAYDQLSQDLCINNNPALILVFWGSLSSMNDVTHLCLFDIPVIGNIPNMVYLAPTCREEYMAMLEWGIRQTEHPVAIRVPANGVVRRNVEPEKDYGKTLNRYEVSHRGEKVAILGLGSFYQLGEAVAARLKEEKGVDTTLVNPRYITGVDEALLDDLKRDHTLVITLEDGVLDGGFGEKIARYYGPSDMKVLNYGVKKEFIDRYDVEEQLKKNRLTVPQIVEDICRIW